MFPRFSKFCLVLGACSVSCMNADEGPDLQEISPEITAESFAPVEIAEVSAPVTSSIPDPVVMVPTHTAEKSLPAFTGKVKGKKVRLRAGADTDSRIVKELARGDLLTIVGEKGDFYAVQPPSDTKAFVFRSFVLDGVVEGNRVNVRLEPSLEAPVIAHLHSGDQIQGVISSVNNKWYEIPPPSDARFYVAKDLVEYVGGPEVKGQIESRKASATKLLENAQALVKAEMQKSFNDIDFSRLKHSFEVVINDYSEFPEAAERAKTDLAALQEEYIQKKIAFLEQKVTNTKGDHQVTKVEWTLHPTDRMKLWEPIEESLYSAWSTRNDFRSMEEFYEDQKQQALVLTGIMEAYTAPVKRKPGDFILRDKELPVGYLYSTHINLNDFVGKKVTVVAAPRSNNNFAFPAYYVLSVE